MQRIVVWGGCLVGILALFRCQGGAAGGSGESFKCTPVGYWRVVEQRLGGDCSLERAPASILRLNISELDVTEQGSLWRFELIRGGERLDCSGRPSDNRCSMEITCSAGDIEERTEYALSLELTSAGGLSGSNLLSLSSEHEKDEMCKAEFDLEGELVSPLELEES